MGGYAAVKIGTELEFALIECCTCGVVFAVPDHFRSNLQKTKQQFYCPNGHSQSYTQSEADRLRKELDTKERALTWEKERAASLDKQLRNEQRASKRLNHRISVGVCPCCKRTVSQLAKHMKTKHPEFVTEQQ